MNIRALLLPILIASLLLTSCAAKWTEATTIHRYEPDAGQHSHEQLESEVTMWASESIPKYPAWARDRGIEGKADVVGAWSERGGWMRRDDPRCTGDSKPPEAGHVVWHKTLCLRGHSDEDPSFARAAVASMEDMRVRFEGGKRPGWPIQFRRAFEFKPTP